MVLKSQYCHGTKYKATLLSILPCTQPDPPYAKKMFIEANITLYSKNNNVLLRSNITVKEDLLGCVVRFKANQNKKEVGSSSIDYKGLTCKNMFTKLIYSNFKVKYDPVTCKIFKGNYANNNIDINKIDRAANFIPVREMGVNVWTLNIYRNSECFLCYEVKIRLQLK